MKIRIKSVSLFLCVIMLLSVLCSFASCSDPAVNPENTDNTTKASDQTAEVTAEETILPLEVVDLGNTEFTMLWPEIHSDGHFVHNELAVESVDGDTINNAVYRRNKSVEEAYKITIKTELKKCSQIPDEIRKLTSSGDAPYDAIATNIAFMSPIALENMLCDFSTLKYYNEDMPWWNHKLMESFSISNKKFFATGDIIYSDDLYPYCIFANPKLAVDCGIGDNFYDVVRSKEWTLEKIHEYALTVKSELDSDGVYTANDRHGMVCNANFSRALYYTAGKGMIEIGSDGVPVWAMDKEHAQSVLDRIKDAWHTNEAFWEADDGQLAGLNHAGVELKLFTESQTLFLAEELIIAERIRNSNSPLEDFAILPMPLYNKDSEFISLMNDSVVLGVPANHKDADTVSLVLSAMSRESITTLTPAFFENVLSYRYVNNPDSLAMLQIILKSATPQDVATINDWGGVMAIFKKEATTGDNSFQSNYTKVSKLAQSKLKQYITTLEKIK